MMGSPFRGWPICAACERPVENVATDRDPITGELIITALCHGDREEVKIEERILHETKLLHIGGRVFDRPQLEPADGWFLIANTDQRIAHRLGPDGRAACGAGGAPFVSVRKHQRCNTCKELANAG